VPLVPESLAGNGGAVCRVELSDGVIRCFFIVAPSDKSHNRTIESEQPAATNDASDDTATEHTLLSLYDRIIYHSNHHHHHNHPVWSVQLMEITHDFWE
jgi:hypothetical protein